LLIKILLIVNLFQNKKKTRQVIEKFRLLKSGSGSVSGGLRDGVTPHLMKNFLFFSSEMNRLSDILLGKNYAAIQKKPATRPSSDVDCLELPLGSVIDFYRVTVFIASHNNYLFNQIENIHT
jgi:hypothetical protein